VGYARGDFIVTTYTLLKFAHIISAAVLFGTGVGIAYFMLTAHLSRNIEAMRVVMRNVILADWIFTGTAVVVQPLTGAVLMFHAGWSPDSSWFKWVAALYLAVGACWIPVVVLQYRMARLVRDAASYEMLDSKYHRAFCKWLLLGVPAFVMVLALYALMVFRPGL
jgi:uncharacterized membrane protein